MLKTILFCAILAYLSGVEARRREYAPSYTETTTSEYGAPQRVRNRYGLRNVDEIATTTPEYGAPQRQKGGRHNHDLDPPNTWVNVDGNVFVRLDDEKWDYTGDDLTYRLISIEMVADNEWEIILEDSNGLFVLLAEDGAYKSGNFNSFNTLFANGSFKRGRNFDETTTPEYSVRRRFRNEHLINHTETSTPSPIFSRFPNAQTWRNNDGSFFRRISSREWHEFNRRGVFESRFEVLASDVDKNGQLVLLLKKEDRNFVFLADGRAYFGSVREGTISQFATGFWSN